MGSARLGYDCLPDLSHLQGCRVEDLGVRVQACGAALGGYCCLRTARCVADVACLHIAQELAAQRKLVPRW